MKIRLLLWLLFVLYLTACNSKDSAKTTKDTQSVDSQIAKENFSTTDKTLQIPYSYWWTSSGPFLGMCGDKYSLVLTGTLEELGEKKEQENHTAQAGKIAVHEVLFSRAAAQQHFSEEKFISSDCFFNTAVQQGDKLLLFIYEYEGKYVIPGEKSVLKIERFASAEVQSIKKYIAAKQDALVLRNDLSLWQKNNLGTELQTIIDCRMAQEK